MRIAAIACASVLVVLTVVNFASAKEWRNIKPLHSTREDVGRLIGKPAHDASGSAYYYNLPDEIVVI